MRIEMRLKTADGGHDFPEIEHCFGHPESDIGYYSEGARVFLKVVCLRLERLSRDGYIVCMLCNLIISK